MIKECTFSLTAILIFSSPAPFLPTSPQGNEVILKHGESDVVKLVPRREGRRVFGITEHVASGYSRNNVPLMCTKTKSDSMTHFDIRQPIINPL